MTLRKRGNNNPNRGRAKRKRVAPTPVGDPSLARQRRTASALARRAVSNALAQRMALAALGARAMKALTNYNRPKGLGLSHEPMLIRNRNEVVGNKRIAVYPEDPVTMNKIPKKRAIRVGRHWFDAKTLRRVVQTNPINPLTREPLPNVVQRKFGRQPIPYDLWDRPADSDFEEDDEDLVDIRASIAATPDDPETIAIRKLWSAGLTLASRMVPNRNPPADEASLRLVRGRYGVTIQHRPGDGQYVLRMPTLADEFVRILYMHMYVELGSSQSVYRYHSID